MEEKRKHPRKVVHPDIAFLAANGERVEAVCRDISLGGAFVETDRPAPFNATVTVFLKLPGFDREIAVKSTVRWTKQDGMGVQFGLMGARETHALVSLISP
ncbi:MAG: PilZ domain-containing protein [Polyangiaceae bacterium]|nr:PilZ domain-containing protein [Polyangiaceae bacterium]